MSMAISLKLFGMQHKLNSFIGTVWYAAQTKQFHWNCFGMQKKRNMQLY